MLGTRLRYERVKRGITKEKLAKQVGISPFYVTKIENEISIPGMTIVERIVNFLEMDVRQLMSKALPHPDAIVIDGKSGSTFIHSVIAEHSRKDRPRVLYSPSAEKTEELERKLTDGLKLAKLSLSPETLMYAARTLVGVLKREKIQGLIGTSPDTTMLVGTICAVVQEMKRGEIIPGILLRNADGTPRKIKCGDLTSLVTGLLCELLSDSADVFRMVELLRKAGCREIKVVSIFDGVSEETRGRIQQSGISVIEVFSKLDTLLGPEDM